MIKYKPNCKTCTLCRSDPKLRARIYNATFKREDGDETLKDIAVSIGVSQGPVYNHSKKHLRYMKPTREAVITKSVEKARAELSKQYELSVDQADVIVKEQYEDSLEYVLAEGMKQLRESGKTITVNQILAASKLLMDNKLKKRGQDTEIIKTFMRAQSAAGGTSAS